MMTEQKPFKCRHFEAEIILLCVRWYLRYALSYRDGEEMMAERGLYVDHTTISRWVQRDAPELEKRCRAHPKTTTDSWRVDETYVKIKGFSRERARVFIRGYLSRRNVNTRASGLLTAIKAEEMLFLIPNPALRVPFLEGKQQSPANYDKER